MASPVVVVKWSSPSPIPKIQAGGAWRRLYQFRIYTGTNRVYPRQPDLKDVTMKELKTPEVLVLDTVRKLSARELENSL